MAGDPYRLPGAIRRRAAETPALVAVLPGGAFAGQGDPATPRPYASLTEVSSAPHDWDTSRTRWVHAVVQASIHAATLEAAAAAVAVWEETFAPGVAPLVVQKHDVLRVWCGEAHQLPRDAQAAQATLDYVIVVEVHAEMVRYPH
jgi:hypothetical protein